MRGSFHRRHRSLQIDPDTRTEVPRDVSGCFHLAGATRHKVALRGWIMA